jgi:hypothetical protein
MRMVKGDFVVTGPDGEPMRFKSRRERRDCCAQQHPGSPIAARSASGRALARKPGGADARFGAGWVFLALCSGGGLELKH